MELEASDFWTKADSTLFFPIGGTSRAGLCWPHLGTSFVEICIKTSRKIWSFSEEDLSVVFGSVTNSPFSNRVFCFRRLWWAMLTLLRGIWNQVCRLLAKTLLPPFLRTWMVRQMGCFCWAPFPPTRTRDVWPPPHRMPWSDRPWMSSQISPLEHLLWLSYCLRTTTLF